MSEPYNSDDEVLARLVREAGDPDVTPDPQFAETLRATILDRVGTAEANVIPISVERARPMRRVLRYAVAATVLVAACIWISWMTAGGGSNAMAFSRIADALENLRSATYDITVTSSQEEGENGRPPGKATGTGKGYFLAPSYQRMELSIETPEQTNGKVTIPKHSFEQITIADSQAAKCMMLTPKMKLAMVMDMKKVWDDMEKSGKGIPPDVFEMVRRLVRDGSSGTGEKVQPLGTKEIDGREAVGFKTKNDMGDMILWADPETACPVRIEITAEILGNVHMAMSNFRHDVDLDASLFSLEPPEGYSMQTLEMVTPVEQDLLNTLRVIAEDSEGEFPAKLGMNQKVMEVLMKGVLSERDEQAQEKMDAVIAEVMEKHGGKEEILKNNGNKIPPAVMEEAQKAMSPLIQEQIQKNMPIRQKRIRGITFYATLKPENDPHYAGGGVKLDTPDCPILWYNPTGANNYRVIYADLTVKDMTSAEVEKMATK